MEYESRLDHAWWVLRVGLGLCAFLAGLDKFFNLLTNWEMYLNPIVPRLLHIQPTTFMHAVGIVELIVGIAVFTRVVRYAAYVEMAWLIAIALSLVAQVAFFDIAVRDIEISLAAFTLAKLTEVREMSALSTNHSQPVRVTKRAVA